MTTKGRWINPFLFGGYRLISILPQIKQVKSPVFIIGTGRSGSTLLGMLLSMHREIGFLNEPKAVWHFAYDKEDVIGNYTLQPAAYKLKAADATAAAISRLKKIYGFYLASIFSGRVVDKYPELIFRIEFVKKIFPDAKFIFLQRNGYDTCISTAQWGELHRVEEKDEIHDWWGLNNRKWNLLVEQLVPSSELLKSHSMSIAQIKSPSDMAAVEWIVSMEEGMHYLRKYPESIFPVKYEELTGSPAETMNKIFSFCSLPADPKSISYAEKIAVPNNRKNAEVHIAPYLSQAMDLLMKEIGY